eukprot:7266560-Prymnesium_polylepis.1
MSTAWHRPAVGFNTTQKEDCPTLNIWIAPDRVPPPPRFTPIFAFLHGGSSIVGSAANPLNHPAVLAHGGYVAVNLNYREGALGYLGIASPLHIDGMFGVQDSIAAHTWLNRNAKSLDGDAGKLVVWGQLTGGTMVQSLIFAPEAKSLFSAAISMSGSPRMNDTFSTATSQSAPAFLDRSNCTECHGHASSAPACEECLLEMTPTQLIEASPLRVPPWWDPWGAKGVPMSFTDIPSGAEAATPPASLIFADGETVPFPPTEAFAKGSFNDVPLIISSMAQEVDFGPKEKDLGNLTEDGYAMRRSCRATRVRDYRIRHPRRVRNNQACNAVCRRTALACVPLYRLSIPIALFELYGNDWVQHFSSPQLDQILLLKTYNNPVSGEHRYKPSTSDERVPEFLCSACLRVLPRQGTSIKSRCGRRRVQRATQACARSTSRISRWLSMRHARLAWNNWTQLLWGATDTVGRGGPPRRERTGLSASGRTCGESCAPGLATAPTALAAALWRLGVWRLATAHGLLPPAARNIFRLELY